MHMRARHLPHLPECSVMPAVDAAPLPYEPVLERVISCLLQKTGSNGRRRPLFRVKSVNWAQAPLHAALDPQCGLEAALSPYDPVLRTAGPFEKRAWGPTKSGM